MRLPEISVRRPVLAMVFSLLIVLVGAVSYWQLSVREYPRIESAVVSVTTVYGGAASEVIESQITKLLEDNLSGIEGVETISSISRTGRSQISLSFLPSRDQEDATNDVRDKVSRIRGRLPDGIEEPVISKSDPDAFPVVWVALSSDVHTPLQLSDFANQIGKPMLQTAPGVSEVRIFGERKTSMRISLDPERMAAYQVTVQDIEAALRSNNLEAPTGSVEGRTREVGITAATSLRTVQDFAQLVIKRVNAQAVVRLSDVAQVREGALDEANSVRLNGKDAVSLGVIRTATANPMDLSKGVRDLLPRLQDNLPAGVEVSIANDNSVFIEESIRAVYTTIIEAVVLVCIVIFLFLRTLRASVIPLITIPISLIGTFAVMAALGYSVNTLTLLALVLAIGMVVDDAIVVLENIFRHIENGMKPVDAAILGGREIGFAVIAMTLTLAAVFLPLVFTPGRTGQLFVEFAVALSCSVIISGFVSLTLTPMMCAKLLRHETKPSRFDTIMAGFFDRLTNGYGRVLGWVLRRSWVVMVVLAMSLGSVVWLFQTIKKELAPMEDRGVVLVNVSAPDGATFEHTKPYIPMIEAAADKYPEFDRVFTNISGSGGNVFYRALPWSERSKTTMDMANELRPQLSRIAGVSANVNTPPSLGQGFGSRPLSYVITTNASYADLAKVVREFEFKMQSNAGLTQVENDLRMNQPQIRLEILRDRAASLGVNVDAVTRTLETMMSGRNVTRYQKGSELYDVRLQAASSMRNELSDIDRLFVRTSTGAMVPLSSLVQLREEVVPRELRHFGQRRSATLSANLAPNYSLGEALAFMDATAKEVLEPGYGTDLAGQSRDFKSSQGSIAVVFALAIVFIFLVLAAQFESFVDPLVILVTVPLSILGALLALRLTGGTLNIFSQIGIITLIGLITKHGILIVEFANQLRDQGLDKLKAVQQSAMQRFRPILMTALAMVLGAVPLALATGAGAESRSQMGWVIVGGMLLGTVLTLFVVPSVYLWWSRPRHVVADPALQ